MGVDGIGGSNPFQQVNFVEESKPNTTPSTVQEETPAVQEEIQENPSQKNSPSPTSLFGGQDFSGVGGTKPAVDNITPRRFPIPYHTTRTH